MSRIQLSRARRQVRRVKTASHRREEASTGHKRGEAAVKQTDFNAGHGRMQLWSLHSAAGRETEKNDQNDQVVARNRKRFPDMTCTAGLWQHLQPGDSLLSWVCVCVVALQQRHRQRDGLGLVAFSPVP